MPYLLVNDSDGQVLAELDSAEQGLRLLERLTRRHRQLAEGISIVHFQESRGSLAGASTSVTVRVPPHLPGAPGVPDLR